MEVRAIRRLLMEVRAVRDKSAGRVEDFPGPVVPEENAAVLEILEKNGAFDELLIILFKKFETEVLVKLMKEPE